MTNSGQPAQGLFIAGTGAQLSRIQTTGRPHTAQCAARCVTRGLFPPNVWHQGGCCSPHCCERSPGHWPAQLPSEIAVVAFVPLVLIHSWPVQNRLLRASVERPSEAIPACQKGWFGTGSAEGIGQSRSFVALTRLHQKSQPPGALHRWQCLVRRDRRREPSGPTAGRTGQAHHRRYLPGFHVHHAGIPRR